LLRAKAHYIDLPTKLKANLNSFLVKEAIRNSVNKYKTGR
jgi:hypothetical protein